MVLKVVAWWSSVPGEKGGWRIFPGFCSELIIQFINGEKVEFGLHFKDVGFCQNFENIPRAPPLLQLSSSWGTMSNCVRTQDGEKI